MNFSLNKKEQTYFYGGFRGVCGGLLRDSFHSHVARLSVDFWETMEILDLTLAK